MNQLRGPAARRAGRRRAATYEEILGVVMALQRDFLTFRTRFEFGELSRLHMGVLGELSKRGSLPVSVIAAKLAISKPQMTVTLDRLEELRLVRRGGNASDRRVTMVSMTDAGRICLEAGRVSAHRSMTERLSVLTDEELAEFGDALRVMERVAAKIH